jgi:hypothetical protein
MATVTVRETATEAGRGDFSAETGTLQGAALRAVRGREEIPTSCGENVSDRSLRAPLLR